MRKALSSLLFASILRAQAPTPERIIFDTDCAYFNDDGAALVMLLNRPETTDVVGLTIVPRYSAVLVGLLKIGQREAWALVSVAAMK